MAATKGVREDFARFFEEPTREGLREVLRNNVGEADELDFKREWPEASKLARHVLGLANRGGGGCVVAGVDQTPEGHLDPVGMPALADRTDLLGGMAPYLPDVLERQLEVLDFSYQDSEYPALKGSAFQVLFVPDDPRHLPFIAARDGKNVSASVVYTRRNAASEPAGNEEFQRIVNRRLETGYSSRRELDLREHLEQLRVLFEQMARPTPDNSGTAGAALLGWLLGGPEMARKVGEPSPRSFAGFLLSTIERKKRLIEDELGL